MRRRNIDLQADLNSRWFTCCATDITDDVPEPIQTCGVRAAVLAAIRVDADGDDMDGGSIASTIPADVDDVMGAAVAVGPMEVGEEMRELQAIAASDELEVLRNIAFS